MVILNYGDCTAEEMQILFLITKSYTFEACDGSVLLQIFYQTVVLNYCSVTIGQESWPTGLPVITTELGFIVLGFKYKGTSLFVLFNLLTVYYTLRE